MIIAYHAVFTTYDTWLPNDPRGSYSKEIYNDQLSTLGRIKYGRQNPTPDRRRLLRFWTAAKPHLGHPPVFIDDNSRPIIAAAFGKVVQRLGIKVPACAIMNDHVHVLVLQYIVNQLKGGATKAWELKHTLWTRGCWKVFISDSEALQAAVEYIRTNPVRIGLGIQSWNFITPV